MRQTTKRIHFTKKAIEALCPPAAGRITVYDTGVRELGLRIASSGRKTFFWFKKVNGRPTFESIGVVPATSIEQARGRAHELESELDQLKRNNFEGKNPFDRSDVEMTFEVLIERYIEKRVREKSTNPERAETAVRWMVRKYLSHWSGRKLDQIRRQDVRELHDRLGREHGKVTADRVVQLIRRIYNWASSGKVELYSGENPATRIEFHGYNKRDRFLQPDELVRVVEALESEPNQDFRDFVELALATGARKSNVLGMEWAQINDETLTWTITKTKTGKPIVLPLMPAAIAVLKRRHHLCESGPWVFPSALSASGHLQEPKKPWKQLLQRAQITAFTIHDLRRTNASYQSIAGSSLQTIAKTLGHASVSSTEIYAKLNTQAARESMLAGVRTMERAMVASRKTASKLLTAGKPKRLKVARHA